MGFRLRRSARLGPLRFNFSSGRLSSISVARRSGSPYPAAPARTPEKTKDGAGKKEIPPHARGRVPRSG